MIIFYCLYTYVQKTQSVVSFMLTTNVRIARKWMRHYNWRFCCTLGWTNKHLCWQWMYQELKNGFDNWRFCCTFVWTKKHCRASIVIWYFMNQSSGRLVIALFINDGTRWSLIVVVIIIINYQQIMTDFSLSNGQTFSSTFSSKSFTS